MFNFREHDVKLSKKYFIIMFAVLIVVSILSLYKLPYYIYTPGKATNLEDIITIEGEYESAGSFHLLTVGGRPATPLLYAVAKLSSHHDIVPIKEARPDGITDEEYTKKQLELMENSQEAALVVAYEAADANIDITYNGVYVLGTVEDMPAEDILEVGDLITKVDDTNIYQAKDLMTQIENMDEEKAVEVSFKREEKDYMEDISLAKFPEKDQVGIGIQLITNREVDVKPEVEFTSGKIGGPSAGLMFALTIYNQLTEEDLTSGLKIAGTGQLDYEGNVLPIGGIDKKVIAADKKDIEFLFAPSMETHDISNYDEAKQTANEIDSDMEIIPVETFQDALDYLKTVDQKN